MINQLTIKLKNMMKFEKLQQHKEMITQQDVHQIINTLKKIINQLQLTLVSKKNYPNADPRAIQEVEFFGLLETNSQA